MGVAGGEIARLPVMGREDELAVLGAGFGRALDSHGGLCVVFGEAGMGKTRLAEWTDERAREQGARVLWGRCWETIDTPAYWPWSQVVRQAMEPLSPEERNELVGSARAAIARMVPEVVDPPGEAEDGSTSRIVEFEALIGFFRRAAQREPIVILLEDLHAADESSKLLLQCLAREVRDDRIFIVATCDLSEIDAKPTHGSLIADVAREGTSIYLRGIGEESIAQLYEAIVGQKPSAPIALGLQRATEGNPLFVSEAIAMFNVTGDLHRSGHSTGFRVPRSVRDMFRRRLSGVHEETHALLSMASVIGREFNASLLARVAELEGTTTLDLLDAAVKVGLIHETGDFGRYRFAHVLIRETVYEDLSPANRMRVHRLVAEAVEENDGMDGETRLIELAHHWFKAAQAGDSAKALTYTEKAAESAVARGAHEEAARLYQRALKVAEIGATSEGHLEALKEALLAARAATGSLYPETTSSPQELRFAREGEYWTIVYQGTTSRIKDSKGLGFVAQLLRAPGREFHVLDLVRVAEGNAAHRAAFSEEGFDAEGFGDAGDVLDAAAKSAYRERIETLRQDIEEADSFNDPERSARAKEELDALVSQLSAAVGLGGRDRKGASVAERARVSVTKTVKDALRKISESDPTLGSHLVSTIKTGSYCSYTPDPRVPIEWLS